MNVLFRAAIAACIFVSFFISAGVDHNTIVQTNNGPVPLKVIKVGDKLLCTNMKTLSIEERSVCTVEEVETQEIVEITTSDNVTFYVTPYQKLFVAYKWVEAQQLTLEDVLIRKDRTVVKVVSIRHIEKPMTLRFITVDEHHNFLVAENGILIHNGPILATIGSMTWRFIAYGTVATTVSVTVAACATTAAPLAVSAGTLVSGAAGVGTVDGAILAGVAATGENGAMAVGVTTGVIAVNAMVEGTTAAAIATASTIESAATGIFTFLCGLPTP